jgi:hypothetical protein
MQLSVFVGVSVDVEYFQVGGREYMVGGQRVQSVSPAITNVSEKTEAVPLAAHSSA